MNRNYNFNDYDLPPEHVNMQHMPVAIVCDTSGSMSGTPIQNVNLSVNRFTADVCKGKTDGSGRRNVSYSSPGI